MDNEEEMGQWSEGAGLQGRKEVNVDRERDTPHEIEGMMYQNLLLKLFE